MLEQRSLWSGAVLPPPHGGGEVEGQTCDWEGVCPLLADPGCGGEHITKVYLTLLSKQLSSSMWMFCTCIYV